MRPIRYIDLFCGIGGFRYAIERACSEHLLACQCVFSSDIDVDAQKAYAANFGEEPAGDITQVATSEIPDHDILLGGFPCQAFSICGEMRGFEDTRGTLFFDIARILKDKQPKMFVLENVRQLVSHNKGNTLARILQTLENIGYYVSYRVLNALHFGLPQKRERLVLVGFRTPHVFEWPLGDCHYPSLSGILENDVSDRYYVSDRIRMSRLAAVSAKSIPKGISIWHENKSGNVSPLPYSCTLRAGASYNYLLVDGKRRLTEREMLRLQGFPECFRVVGTYTVLRKQVGNAVPIPLIQAVIGAVLSAKPSIHVNNDCKHVCAQMSFPFNEC